jgi:hypothetical protein
MCLWLPLSLEEKAQMFLSQRIEQEADLMILLLEQEYQLSENLGNSDKLDVLLERKLDLLIYNKFSNSA